MARKTKSAASTKPETIIVMARIEIPQDQVCPCDQEHFDTDFIDYVIENIDDLWQNITWDVEREK